ncbi:MULTISPECIES: AraC family transcriptional regulator [unclassified Roseateles]|uniref:AraC family transcriptional regulator n=1 Tax=unclassified Roseateles TaxID=2626991 RepID=UPI0006F3734E|nr:MULTISPECIES: AraC family transcriptional regulator [unclassified Roseateles]KQW52170.1 AraC family transcriptional regulator [Pelomonas sp. Root405]KRA78404.1 AraC family transcriptional regulator [Pelomonas sp. Root662]
MNDLLDAVRRHADARADAHGIAPTSIAGLTTVRATVPGGLVYAISRPLVALLMQGGKQVTQGAQVLDLSAGESLLITADVPTVSQVTRASLAEPYYSLVLELDPAVIAELTGQMQAGAPAQTAAVRTLPTDAEVAGSGLRLLQLLDRPEAVPVLQASLLRELHYWLLAGRHGAAIRRLGWPGGHAERIGRAVALLRREYASRWSVEQLADVAGMSASAFHRHFRATTSLSPLQFQKQLRLIEARRLMLAEGLLASSAAFAVGYESVPQFTREYGRLFGQPPVRDVAAARLGAQAA